MKKEIKFRDNMPLEEQIDLLAQYLMENFGDEIKNEGAIEMAIRLLEEYRNTRLINQSNPQN